MKQPLADGGRLLTAALVAVGVAALIYAATRPQEKPEERFRRQVEQEVPVGASRAQAVAWARRMGTEFPVQSYSTAPLKPDKTAPEVAGMSRAELQSFIKVQIPWGTRPAGGKVVADKLWVFMPLDDLGRVRGHYFLTLTELAEYERRGLASSGEQ
jgi:hypothetical protein